MIDIIRKNELNDYIDTLNKRGNTNDGKYIDIVNEILTDIRVNKDEALIKYTKKFDYEEADINNIFYSKEEIKAAYDSLDLKLKEVINLSYKRIYDYHMHQVRKTFTYEKDGEILGQKITPLQSVGIYVPGGKASYPSSVLMNAVPAIVAGVKDITMVSPTPNNQVNKTVLACAYICGIEKVIKIGGAQAIGALAYGTQSIKKVDKIVGPGNIFVALAKKAVFGSVGIDSVAGPSEILVLADDSANPKYVACDLMGQAEHDELASATLITTSYDLALKVKEYVNIEFKNALRKDILEKSLKNYSKIVVLDDIEECISLANEIAPEHLEVCLKEPFSYLDKIQNAGAIFLGNYTPEALGDYMAGPNHVLPTVKTSRFFSPLGVDDFIKKSSIISFSKEALLKLTDYINTFATEEGLQMHARSAYVREE